MAAVDDHRLLAAQAALTGRDLRLLGWLYDHGVLTTEQIATALFSSLDVCQRRLLKLTHLRVLARFRPQRWEGGSYPYHYVLDQLGADVVAAQRGDEPPRRDQARKRRHHLTSRANLPHLLGTNQFFIDLAAHERTHSGSALLRWWPAAAFHAQGAFYNTGDDPNIMLIKPIPRPDGHGIWAENGREVPFLLELDLATEPLRVLADKVRGYDLLASMTNWRWPVLFWLPSTRRELNFHHVLTDLGAQRAIVATAAADHATRTRQSPAEQVWWLHRHEGERLRLSQLPHRNPNPSVHTNSTE